MVKRGISFLIIVLLIFSTISFAQALSQQNLTYDGNGNLITGDGKYREYDEFNQLVRVRAGFNNQSRVLEEYLYHPTEDRILAKKVYDFNQNLAETIIYVSDNLVRKINTTGTYDTVYVKDENGIVAEVTNSTKTFYHDDHLGSTSLTTNQSGSVVEETFYDPYGAILEGGNKSRYDYEGKEFSSGTGGYGEGTSDYDFNFRKYDTGLAIFTQPDAVIPGIYNPQQLNKYSFELRNPYRYVDENGYYVETAIDVGFVAYDIYQLRENPHSVLNWIALGADITFTALPFLTAGGSIVRGVGKVTQETGLSFAQMTAQRGTLRANVAEARGLSQIPQGYQVHHVFPVKFADEFAKLGIDINKYGNIVQSSPHLSRSSYITSEWTKFFSGEGATFSSSVQFASRIESGWGASNLYYGFSPSVIDVLKYGFRGSKVTYDFSEGSKSMESSTTGVNPVYCATHSDRRC